MLTVKAPIELKCHTNMVSSWEAFYHRISGNYEVISSGIDHEDLLHVLSVPPEVYIGEGGMTSLVNNTRIQNHQETKLEIINNLLNRIALTEQVDLTYQDRVYITEVLKKLGIQNVSQFMSQVASLKQETQTTERLISFYWNHLEELNQIVQSYSQAGEKGKTVTQNFQSQTDIRLHEEIMSRLQTGAIYQILHNFYSNYNNSNQYISGQELQITEQKRVAANILLNQLKNVVQEDKVPFVYRHENYYETMNLEESQMNQDTMNTQITSAVLLNLIDNLYFSRFEKMLKNRETWLNVENALYQTMENTLWRLKNETSSHFDTRNSRQTLALYQKQAYEQELEAVYQLLDLGREEPLGIRRDGQMLSYNQPAPEEARYERADIQYPVTEEEADEEIILPEKDKEKSAEQYQVQVRRQVERYLGILSLQQRIESRQEEVRRGEQTFGGAKVQEEAKEEKLRLLGEVRTAGTENREADLSQPLSLHYEQGTGEEEEAGNQAAEEDRTKTELRLEKETERLLSEYGGRFVEEHPVIYQKESRNQILTEIYESPLKQDKEEQGDFPSAEVNLTQDQENFLTVEENKVQQTFFSQEENLDVIEQQIKQINQQNIENFNRYQEILRQQEEQTKLVRPSAERMRQESLKALQNPSQLIEEYRQETKVIQQQKLENLHRITELLPEQTRKIYERLEQFQNNPKQPEGQANMAQNSIGLLLHDIQQIERERVTENTLSQKDMTQIHQMSESVLEKWEERQGAESGGKTRTTTSKNDISLVHKSVENQVDEELLQQLFEQNRSLSSKTQVTEHEKEETQVNHTTVHKQTQNTLVKESEDLTELIQRGVQRQIGSISDQVYSKLEKRLQNEKKRRGY